MKHLFWIWLCVACQSTDMTSRAVHDASFKGNDPEIAKSIHALYDAFCFDPGAQPDWQAMQGLFAGGATFASPITKGAPARLADADGFLADFHAWVDSPDAQVKGFHERITKIDLLRIGRIAHAWVWFDGFEPGHDAILSRGVDSTQWVLDAGVWKLASFTTQYQAPDVQFPSPPQTL